MKSQDKSGAISQQSSNAIRLPKVVAIKKEFRTRRPIVVELEAEITDAWLNRGALSLTLSKQYQTRRELVEVIIRDGVRAKLRRAA